MPVKEALLRIKKRARFFEKDIEESYLKVLEAEYETLYKNREDWDRVEPNMFSMFCATWFWVSRHGLSPQLGGCGCDCNWFNYVCGWDQEESRRSPSWQQSQILRGVEEKRLPRISGKKAADPDDKLFQQLNQCTEEWLQDLYSKPVPLFFTASRVGCPSNRSNRSF